MEKQTNHIYQDEFESVVNSNIRLYEECMGTEAVAIKMWVINNPQFKDIAPRIYHRFVKLLRYVNRQLKADFTDYKEKPYYPNFYQRMIVIATEVENDWENNRDNNWRQKIISMIDEEINKLIL